MKQKYLRGYEVKVDSEMPPMMAHFESGFNGIVDHTDSEANGGDDVESYCLVQLDKDRNPINQISWYDEDQLTLVSDDMKKGMEIIESYNLR